MNTYLFVFGNTPQLSFLELHCVLSRFFQSISIRDCGDMAVIETKGTLDPKKLLSILGGTTKIGIVHKKEQTIDSEIIAHIVRDNNTDTTITFGISIYTDTHTSSAELAKEVKTILKRDGYKSRFILPKENDVLSSVVVEKQQVSEVLIAKCDDAFMFAQTCVVQDFSLWAHHDYGRPHARPKRGMLPPKVARMMVNIAIGSRDPSTITLLDPFCGMGTILAESAVLGCRSFGIDINQESVRDAKDNLQWLQENAHITHLPKVFHGDATHVDQAISHQQFDVIVTEPFLGPAFSRNQKGIICLHKSPISREKITNAMRGLQKLYIGSLKHWLQRLQSPGRIVMVLPSLQMAQNGDTDMRLVKKVIDRCENLGYTVKQDPILYARKHAVINRAICCFEK